MEHIAGNIAKILDWTDGDREGFEADEKLQYATAWALETLGEASQRLSPEVRARHPEIDWKGMSGFRVMAAHHYMDLSTERIWGIVVGDLFALDRAVHDELSRVREERDRENDTDRSL